MNTRLSPTTGVVVALLTALAYALVGWIALRMAIPPSYASPIYPSAGIALAASLVYGRWGILGAALGSLSVNYGLSAERGQLGLDAAWVGMVLAGGAALQAGLGRALIQRYCSQPLTLSEPRDLARFYAFGAPVACLASASVATATLTAAGVLTVGQAPFAWWTWWMGDTLGVLIAAPIGLTIIGRPKADWVRRRVVVALPMLLATALLAGATAWVLSEHEERVQTAFERDAWALGERLESQLLGPQRALIAMHSLFDTQQYVDPNEMRKASRAWLDDQPFLAAVGYSERVPRSGIGAFEARVRVAGPVPDYSVFDRSEGDAAKDDPDVVAIRYIEPQEPNRRALGVNAMSIPAAREAIERALVSGSSAATAGFRLTQSATDETGIVLYRPLYRGEPATEEERRSAFIGLVFVTLRLDAMLNELFRVHPTYLSWCLVDADPAAPRQRLAGPGGCERAAMAPLHYERTLMMGGRPYVLKVGATTGSVPGLADGGGWMFSVIGLLATSLLGALLLTVSGRQQRIEAAVAARTADLQGASQALSESQERLRNIVDHVPIGVVYADTDGRVLEANPSLLAMLGLMALPDPPPSLTDWTHPPDREEVAALLIELATGRQALARHRVRLQGIGGEPLMVQLGLSALHDSAGRPRRVVGVVEDIGEHLRLQASERAREQAEASSRAKSDFVSRMSHELRTPLNAMLGFAQLLARDPSPPLVAHQQRWTGQIQDAGWHLLNMINDTLDLSMIESGSLRLTPRALDPLQLLDATMSLVAAAADRRGVRLMPARITARNALIRGDETRVKQILTNLLSNAVKYNVDGGRVQVEVHREDAESGQDMLEILVHDTGLGLSAEQRENLFQPFNRLGREGSNVEGTGIGLVISRRLAELMGGSLDVRSASGQGSTFVLRLPLAEPAAPEADAELPTLTGNSYRQRHVHYVEDNETNVLLMRGMLAQRPQIELTVSGLGLDALMAIRSRTPDLLLLDMHLPDIDGMDLLRHLKNDDATAGLQVLVLSADATRERIERAMTEGAAGYLSKPLNLAELLSRIDELLAQVDTRWG
jgi:PAS domain S-box-containing protein